MSEGKNEHKSLQNNPWNLIIGIIIGAIITFLSSFGTQYHQHFLKLDELNRQREIESIKNKENNMTECISEFGILSTYPNESQQLLKLYTNIAEAHRNEIDANYHINLYNVQLKYLRQKAKVESLIDNFPTSDKINIKKEVGAYLIACDKYFNKLKALSSLPYCHNRGYREIFCDSIYMELFSANDVALLKKKGRIDEEEFIILFKKADDKLSSYPLTLEKKSNYIYEMMQKSKTKYQDEYLSSR